MSDPARDQDPPSDGGTPPDPPVTGGGAARTQNEVLRSLLDAITLLSQKVDAQQSELSALRALVVAPRATSEAGDTVISP